jgi:Mycothiol maleylpyruvate isomerase N-terminal domain
LGVRDDFVNVAKSSLTLLKDPVIAAKWGEPSALEDFSVGGLAFHLADQLFLVQQAAPAAGPAVSLDDYYSAPVWVDPDASREAGVNLVRRMEDAAVQGLPAIIQSAEDALAEVRVRITEAPADLIVEMRGRTLTFDDLLLTRLMEFVVHSDDLAVSVGVPTPEVPESAAIAVVGLLSRIAIRRHGATAVVRALSRSERAPATISAL